MKKNTYITKIKFNTKKFNFRKIVNSHFKKKFLVRMQNLHDKKIYNDYLDLHKINTPIHFLKDKYFDVKNDQSNFLINYFYKIDPFFKMETKNKKEGEFMKTYNKLILFLENHICNFFISD